METLSDYMLLEVFVRLDPASLKKCTEVCKRWNDLIYQSASTMDKMVLEVNGLRKLRDMRIINRRYSNLKLVGITISPKAWSLLLNYQQNLRTLELGWIKITASDFIKMLQSIPSLEELTIIECSKLTSAKRDDIVKMPMLQKLTISDSDELIENIDGSAFKKLEISEGKGFPSYSRFVSSLQQLEDLSLTTWQYGVVCLYFTLAKVQLKKLKISFERDWRSAGIGASSLLKARASTLETLEINSSDDPEGVTDYDLTNVAPFNSLPTRSFNKFYNFLLDVSSFNHSHELIASTAKYYIPQLKFMKIYRPRSA